MSLRPTQRHRPAIWGQGQGMPRQELRKYFKKQPSSHRRLLRGSIYKKSKLSSKFLQKKVKEDLLFKDLDEKTVEKMVEKMYRVDVKPGICVIRQGDSGDAYFVIEKGYLEVWNDFVDDIDDNSMDFDGMGMHLQKPDDMKKDSNPLIDVLGPGDTFGTEAILFNVDHEYTFRAQAPLMNDLSHKNVNFWREETTQGCRCWALDEKQFTRIRSSLVETRQKSSNKLINFLKSIALFKPVMTENLQVISEAMMQMTYSDGQRIVKKGESPTHFFIIYKGTCDAVEKDENGQKRVVRSYGKKEYFGELGIMNNQPRAMTVKATSTLTVYVLPAIDFKSLLNYDIVKCAIKKQIGTYAVIPKDSKSILNKVHCRLEQFKQIGVLGGGAFSRVFLVEDPFSKKVYAMKKVSKNRVIETRQQQHILNEKRIMSAVKNMFCVKLYATYQDKMNVYFLLDAILGGELFSLVRHQRSLTEQQTKFYCACVVLAFSYLHHKLGVVYRDLKPENVMISENGYCKLVDFGFAKKRNKTSTLCGTPQYLAPEVIQNLTQGFAVDWWSIGILIHELLFGYPPFEGDAHMKMYECIIAAPLDLPNEPKLKPETQDFITCLLRKQAHKRLGSGTRGAEEVKEHPFFKRWEWDKMMRQELSPPWRPKLKSKYDLSAFEILPNIPEPKEKLIVGGADLYKWCDEF